MPTKAERIQRAKPPRTYVGDPIKTFNTADRALDNSDLKATLKKVPVKTADGLWNHIRGFWIHYDANVDSDGTPAADISTERVLAQVANVRLKMLDGAHTIFPGGDVDLRLLHFLTVAIREQRAEPDLPADAGNASAADIFSGGYDVHVTFPGYASREGGTVRDGLIPRAFFVDLDGEDALLMDHVAEDDSTSVGAIAGVTVNVPDSFIVFPDVVALPYPVIEPLQFMRYVRTDDLERTIEPINIASRTHLTEYAGFVEKEEDDATDTISFATAGTLTDLTFGDKKHHLNQTAANVILQRRLGDYHSARPDLATRFQPIGGHYPLCWAGGLRDRGTWGRTPLNYEIAALGSNRTQVRICQTEIHTWNNKALRVAAEALDVPFDKLVRLLESVETVDLDPAMLPRRVVFG